MKGLFVTEQQYDVIVVGGGNAAFSAALSARERGASVLMLEKAPEDEAGGNSFFTAAATRTTFDSLDDLRPILTDVDEHDLSITDLPPYTVDHFTADMQRLTEGRCDPELSNILVGESANAVNWWHEKGLKWTLMYARQSFKVDGRFKFWGGLALGGVGEGKGLIEQETQAARNHGVEIRYETPVFNFTADDNGVISGVMACGPDGIEQIRAKSVILASGGFESDPRMRAMYLGPNWDVAKVRGTAHNTGEVLMKAIDIGAQPYGHWSGCHSIAWDAAAPPTGDWELTHRFSKQSYPIGLIINRDGERFVDEGADFRNYTYAKYGAEILKQPGAVAYQLYDARTAPLLRQDEYTAPGVSRHEAASVGELAEKIGVAPAKLERTIREYNEAVQAGEFNPAVKDGKGTIGVTPPKSNWAQPLDAPPLLAFAVTCGITFTFGGIRVDRDARVLDRFNTPIPGLYAAGELVGGLFYHNYPGGSGLTNGMVFGRRAGDHAARS
jgi:tricarballylate dehydrogenase